MGKQNYTHVKLPPIHEVSKIIPATEYWLRKNVLVGSFGVSSTTYVQCSCGMKFRNTDFQNHLTKRGVVPKHFLKATLHSRVGKIYSCDCGCTFKTVEDLAEHVGVAKLEKITSLPTPAERLSISLSSAFSTVGHLTDNLSAALGRNEKRPQK